jgi:hypothetical protein
MFRVSVPETSLLDLINKSGSEKHRKKTIRSVISMKSVWPASDPIKYDPLSGEQCEDRQAQVLVEIPKGPEQSLLQRREQQVKVVSASVLAGVLIVTVWLIIVGCNISYWKSV